MGWDDEAAVHDFSTGVGDKILAIADHQRRARLSGQALKSIARQRQVT